MEVGPDSPLHSGVAPRFPFSAIVGQHRFKKALLLNAVDPRVGGVLIRGERGTAKSTAVRALAAVLPPLRVVEGCEYRCDPDDVTRLCERCRGRRDESASLPSHLVAPRIVELPVSATEDRVVGTLDFEVALAHGERSFQPGILASANRAILYVDEVNLLDDHLVDTLLDAAVTGVNVVEREAVSVVHPASFILVGTMNPEEGEVRPQLLDRFGLCVEVTSVPGAEQRVEIIRRRRSFESDPLKFIESFAEAQEAVRAQVADARLIIDSVELPDDILYAIADLSVRAHVDGHRADSVMARAAAANAALDGRSTVGLADIEAVAELVLAHRLRKTPFHNVGAEAESLREALRQALGVDTREATGGVDEPSEPPPPVPGRGQGVIFEDIPPARSATPSLNEAQASLSAELDRVRRESAGRRQRSLSSDKRGRYLRSEQPRTAEKHQDIALDATIRAVAARSAGEHAEQKRTARVSAEDIRTKIRTKPTTTTVILCVDASGSMGAARRVEAAKSATMELLSDAYVKRDRVALVTFRGDAAEVVLPPTSSIELARLRLAEVALGGSTPLAAGLEQAYAVASAERRRDPDSIVWLVLITDGRANVGKPGISASDDALRAARRVSTASIRSLVLDTETSPNNSAALGLAHAMKGEYVRLSPISRDTIVGSVAQRLHGAE